MTDENIASVGDTPDQPVVNDEAVSATPLVHKQSEDVLPRSRVNELIHERTREASQKAYERGRQEAEKQRSQQTGMGGMPQLSEGELRSMMQDEFKKQQNELLKEYQQQEFKKQIDNLTNDFLGKIVAAKEKYPDLQKRQDEIGDLARLVPYINETDEVPGITQHLLDNGHNVASLLVLAETSPNFLRRELKKLANSIKTNDEARNRPHVNEPLSQPTPSVYTTDSGSDSIEALKQQPWLRG